MHIIDWILFLLPVAFVVFIACKAQRYVHGVADFLSAGRIAHRYVLSVASGEANFGLITLVGSLEAYYNSGFAYGFWGSIIAPVGMVLGLVGFCNYRFRETRAMTMGQFFEMRYSRPFRITASFVQAFYGVLNYAIFPAVGARFLMYFLRLPVSYSVFGLEVSTFATLMLIALAIACFIACAGGQITIMVTDCVQGIISYPIYLLVAVFFLTRFSWWNDLLPALSARPDGSSFLNPFDTGDLRDFNIFYVMSGLLSTFLMRLSWGSRGYDSAAKDAHEAKMGAVLGTWRAGFGSMMFVLIGVIAYSFHNSPKFAAESAHVRANLAAKAYEDVTFGTENGSDPADAAAMRAAAEARASGWDDASVPLAVAAAREEFMSRAVEGGTRLSRLATKPTAAVAGTEEADASRVMQAWTRAEIASAFAAVPPRVTFTDRETYGRIGAKAAAIAERNVRTAEEAAASADAAAVDAAKAAALAPATEPVPRGRAIGAETSASLFLALDAVTDRSEQRIAKAAAKASHEAQVSQFMKESADDYLKVASDAFGGGKTEEEIQAMDAETRKQWSARRARNQTFGTIFTQMRVPATIRGILPTGLVGLFCAMALFLMLTTDTTYLHGWASVIVQDCLLPLRKKPWAPKQQIRNLRVAICCVAASAFVFSYYFGQVDFIMMFFAITGALWMASGPIITLGLYWKRGTTAGAFTALLLGASTAIAAIFAQKYWVSSLYPWIAAHGLGPGLDHLLRTLSSPFEPWIHWELTPDKFPINSVEVGVITQLFTLLLYVLVSLATCRQPFNMDRLLHRGAYADEREKARETTRVPLLQRILGIDGNYTRGDKALAWSVFIYSFCWSFCLCFLGNVIWHVLGANGILPPQPESWWGLYFFIGNVCVACVIGIVSTFWFGICSTRDLVRLFRDLEERERAGGGLNTLDDGRVEGHVSLADAAEIARIESQSEKE